MLDIEDRSLKPDTEQLITFVDNSAFSTLCSHMNHKYNAIEKIEYSGDKALLGWNLKFKKGGRTLCTVYPRVGHFFMLLVVGKKEKEQVQLLLPHLCKEFQQIYSDTLEGMGQRWLLLDINSCNNLYKDALKIIQIRRTTK